MKRRIIALILSALLLLPGIIPALQISAVAETPELSTGVQNIVKRAYQMTNIQWTPVADITGWDSGLTYKAGKTYTGLPYGQPVYTSYVPWSTDLNGFISAVNNPNSKMYTSYSSYNCRAPYYSTDCSAFVSWAWGLSSRQTTSSIHNFATQISKTSYANAQVGDCLCLAGSHVVLITDITYDNNGNINSIEISESTVNAATNYCCQITRYGVGGSKTLNQLKTKYFDAGYILYRSRTRDNVTYTHSCAVPLEGDICDACGLGSYTETPLELTVRCDSNLTLYRRPSNNADSLGTVYAGSQLEIVAYFEEDSGVLWYKTADAEWILAAKTSPVCQHSYSYQVLDEPTCTENGTGVYSCVLCGDEISQTLLATGHSYQAIVIPSRCETGGYTSHTCSACSDSYRDADTPATGHRYENGNCANCGEKDPNIQKGDLTGDGEITSADAVLLARYLADLQALNETQKFSADTNGDGMITSADAVLLARHLAGLD